ncbi:hypothetical protein [Rhodanobacter sp. MP7CTX1]|uniref:hypothetical protein n=1 Tax=Rhodanobacter sp. MP7CTX1 TaxID=2723084 RepID=UPI00161D6C09|nr:hypothetical protein [Rhodanobacter sp. MP7CTX1]MBB6186932.1 hypothetical protein [Rhodanobacter sp. MP7CTX1]
MAAFVFSGFQKVRKAALMVAFVFSGFQKVRKAALMVAFVFSGLYLAGSRDWGGRLARAPRRLG